MVKNDAEFILEHFQLKHSRNIPGMHIFTVENLIKSHFFSVLLYFCDDCLGMWTSLLLGMFVFSTQAMNV